LAACMDHTVELEEKTVECQLSTPTAALSRSCLLTQFDGRGRTVTVADPFGNFTLFPAKKTLRCGLPRLVGQTANET
jgi:hypothetical protein